MVVELFDCSSCSDCSIEHGSFTTGRGSFTLGCGTSAFGRGTFEKMPRPLLQNDCCAAVSPRFRPKREIGGFLFFSRRFEVAAYF